MLTRSKVPLSEKNEDLQKKDESKRKRMALETAPFITYKGKIYYYNTFHDCAYSAEKLLNFAESLDDEHVFGFDLEWPFNFKTGSGKVAVIQISPNLDECYVFQLNPDSRFTKLPKVLIDLLIHPKVKFAGNNIKNDARKLAKDFNLDGDVLVDKCIDLGVYANSVLNRFGRWSLERLVNEIFELRINKDKEVRNSKWHVVPLSEKQLMYAAIDAYVSLKLHQHLKELSIKLAVE